MTVFQIFFYIILMFGIFSLLKLAWPELRDTNKEIGGAAKIIANERTRKFNKAKFRLSAQEFNSIHGFRVALPEEIKKGRAKARNGRKISPRKRDK